MGRAESMKYCRAKAIPSALFGGGIPNGDCTWATPVGNALYRVALGFEQDPGKGQKMAPNLAVEEQSGAPTWAAELAVANASLSNRLLSAKGPTTWPKLFAKAKMAHGGGLGMQMPKYPQTSNKAGKKFRAKRIATTIVAQSHRASRAAGKLLGEGSNRHLYCSLTKGVIPQVCGPKSQNFLERQAVGLAPFPPVVGPTSSKHCKCGQPQGVAHVVFKCQEVVIQRQSLLAALDGVRSGMAKESAWGDLTDTQKLEQSFCPSRIDTLSAPEACTFYSASARVWGRFYDDAEDVLSGMA